MADEGEVSPIVDTLRIYECKRSNCDKKFRHQSTRSAHQKTCSKGTLPKANTTFPCPNVFCRKKTPFTSAFNLKRHLQTCRPKTKSQFVCIEPDCGKIFDKPSKLARHRESHNKPSYTCQRCWKKYTRLDKCKVHQADCSGSLAAPSTLQCSNASSSANITRPSMAMNANSDADNLVNENQHLNSLADLHLESNEIIHSFDTTSSFHTNEETVLNDSTLSLSEDFVSDANHVNDEASLYYGTPSVSENFVSISINADASYVPGEVYILDEMCSDQSIASEQAIDFEGEISRCTITYLKTLKHQSKRSCIKLQEFAKMCTLLFSHKFDDQHFMAMLADELGFVTNESFLDFINLDRVHVNRRSRGRPLSDIVSRQTMYNYWKQHSVISNDRRNARHVIKTKPTKLDPVVVDLSDSQITECNTKGGTKLKAQKNIYTLTTREMFMKFKSEHPDVKCSSSVFYRCKPFYIAPATPREMEGCLCQKCLNPHSLYTTIRRYIKNLPLSLSEYLTTFFTCQKDGELNYPKVDCIKGQCKNNCKIMDESEKEEVNWNKHVSFYQFETITERYHNRQGEEKFYKRVARQDYKDVPLREVYDMLMKAAEEYLLHRYYTLLDKVSWAKYLGSINAPVVWMDYSMNVNLVEKNQAQSAHFSGRQQTLHDTLIQRSDAGYTYIYHLSDDLNHDSVMTRRIIEDNIYNHHDIISSGRLVLRSDNCSTQYKSRFVFQALLEIAEKNSIRINCFFGEAGHGRGLIDAMAWFGCKGPMRKQILTTDEWFQNAEEMTNFLKTHFKDEVSKKQKEYILIKEEYTAEIRKKGRAERPCPGCRDSHVLSFYPDGTSVKMWHTIKDYMSDGPADNIPESPDEEEEEVDWIESIESMDKFNLIEVDSFVAIKATAGHVELFHLMQVLEKRIATDHISDSSKEHCVLKGEPYIICKWFSFSNDGRKVATYIKCPEESENALIHIDEVISTNIEINKKQYNNAIQYQMDIADYRMLVCSIN